MPIGENLESQGHPSYPSDKPIAFFPSTEIGNADRLIYYHGRDLRYCYPWKRWIVWQGSHWQEDRNGEIDRRMEDVARKILLEAAREDDSDQRQAKAKWALTSMSNKIIKGSIERAQSKVPVVPEELDTHLFLLNCRNGTLDLKSGNLLPHEREHYLTKTVPITYNQNAMCPLWNHFLDQIMGNRDELVGFLQRAIGYTLTGDTREQVMFILHGIGSNGKSTILETIAALMGDYSQQAPPETLMARKDKGIPNDIARMRGARFISAVETEEGRRLSEVLVKQLTGGDMVTARFLNQEFFEFTPSHKIFLATNHLPRVKGTDHAIWRRLPLIPFNIRFWNHEKGETGEPHLRVDKTLKARLLKELPGILNWALEGCISWQRDGMGWPEEVRAATNAYKANSDTLAAFLEEECQIGDENSIAMKELFAAYTRWCSSSGEIAVSKIELGKRLEERGMPPGRGTGGFALRRGIRLAAQTQLDV